MPYYLQGALRKWVDQGITGDSFEKVADNEAITWCSPVVVQLFPKVAGTPAGKLKAYMIWASVDYESQTAHGA